MICLQNNLKKDKMWIFIEKYRIMCYYCSRKVGKMTILKPKDMANKLGITVRTLQEWDRKNIFKAHRTPTNRRYYMESDYLKYINGQIDQGELEHHHEVKK